MLSHDTAFDLLTVKEVAALLHCSKGHVCNVVAGRVRDCPPLPAIHIGRRMLIRRESLHRWLEQTESDNVKLPKTA
jgi:excisionase family DNA binding protein